VIIGLWCSAPLNAIRLQLNNEAEALGAKPRKGAAMGEPVGEGVLELRVHVGPGYRVYCARHGRAVVLLLTGGDKSSQQADIKQAKELWAEWKRRQR
jgi:putative addiction module killer protein